MSTQKPIFKTSTQMLKAPQNAIFVWPNAQLFYPAKLARFLDRGDLAIVAASNLMRVMCGSRRMVVVDHFCDFHIEVEREVRRHNEVLAIIQSRFTEGSK